MQANTNLIFGIFFTFFFFFQFEYPVCPIRMHQSTVT